MLISLLERSDSPFLLRGDLTWLFLLKMSSISEILQGKGREGKEAKVKNSISLSLFPLSNNISQEALLHHRLSELPVSISLLPSHRANSTRNLLFVVRLWRISRGMNHLFQEIINIINIIILSLPLTYILINILLTRLYRNIKLAFEEFRVSKWENENEISVERRWWIGMELDVISNGGSKVCFWIEL